MTNSALSLVCDLVTFSVPIFMISLLKLSNERKVMLAFVLLPGTLVVAISIVRLYLCVVGQWASDGSWFYDPQLAIEVAEIGGTLIALSIPSIKPLIGTVLSKMKSTAGHSTDPSQDYGKGRSYTRHNSGAPDICWQPGGTDGSSNKTLVNANHLSKHSERSSRGSDSDEDLLASIGSRNIFVHTDVAMTSIPRALYRGETTDRIRREPQV